MKSYKKATLVAKNARSGSYAAGCPTRDRGWDHGDTDGPTGCMNCERTE